MQLLTPFILLCVALAQLSALEVGQKGPSLAKVNWVKGAEVEVGSTVTVVEFWATWCGPCLQTIPHLTELQKKHGKQLHIVGLSQEKVDTVKPFVAKMGDKMDYHIGVADKPTYDSYMSGVGGIPHAFIVDASGTVVWAGHPAGMDGALTQVLAGKFDATKAAAVAKVETELKALLQARELTKAVGKIDEILKIDPVNEKAIALRINIGSHQKNPQVIGDTMALVDQALKADSSNVKFMGTKAQLFATMGLMDQAITWQQKAVDQDKDNKELAETLEYYKGLKKLAGTITSAP